MIRSLALLLIAGCAAAGTRDVADDFSRSTPEAEGVASSAILGLVEALDKIDSLNSLMIVRHGRVIAEGWWAPYTADANHELYSLSKSFAATAVGFAVAEGKLSLDDEVLKFFPEDAPAEVPANLKAMRVRDLLTMSAGHQDETSSAADRITAKSFLAHPVPHKPGTHFKYNTPATFMCSAIVQKVSGQPIVEYLKPRLFEPLGIAKPVWNANAQGISLGGYGLRVRTEDIARFGQLYLRKGRWNGKQLLPASWVELATSRQVSNGSNPKSDWEQGYGFQFWRCRNGAYRGDGAFGQYCVVLPEQDVVIAITSGLKDMQAVLNHVWNTLLPGIRPDALPAAPGDVAALKKRLDGLKLRSPEGAAGPGVAAKRTYTFPDNEQKLETLSWDGSALLVKQNGAERKIACGHREWVKGPGSWGAYKDEPAAAAAAWTSDDTLLVKQCFTETPFVATWTLKFSGDELSCSAETNVGFGASKKLTLTGRAR